MDQQGDIWSPGEDGLMHSPETAPFSMEYVEKKWGPLRELPNDDAILEQLAAAEDTAERASSSCQVCLTLPKLGERVRPAVEAALEGKIGQRTLSQILSAAGYDVGVRAITYHRSGHTKRRA